jgi:hypothetical protein
MSRSLPEYVDVDRLPTIANYHGESVSGYVGGQMNRAGKASLLRPHTSLGFVIGRPGVSLEALSTLANDDPYGPIWFAGGYGPEQPRFTANAFRKLWAACLEGRDTLDLATDPNFTFIQPVESQEPDGRFRMGSFPWGGAVIVHMAGLIIPAAVSALYQEEDDALAAYGARLTGAQILHLAGSVPAEAIRMMAEHALG